MKLLRYIPLILLFCSLAACDERFFSHPIDYKGNTQAPKMVVSTELCAEARPEVFVNTAYFVNDSNRADTVEMILDRPILGQRKGYRHNALVELRVNGGEWMPLAETHDERVILNKYYYFNERYYNEPVKEEVWFYTCNYLLQPGDSVEIHVHDDGLNADACVTQRIPHKINAYISDIDSMSYTTADMDYYLLLMTLHLDACPQTGDLLRITAHTYAHNINYNPSQNTEHRFVRIHSDLYAQDVRFSAYLNLCSQFSQGWFGSINVGLFANTPFSESAFPIAVIYEPTSARDNKDGEPLYRRSTDSIVIDVQLVNRDAYLYTSSLAANRLIRTNPRVDFWANQGYNETQEIINDTEEWISNLGTLETSPTYSNIQGALGYATSASGTTITLHPN